MDNIHPDTISRYYGVHGAEQIRGKSVSMAKQVPAMQRMTILSQGLMVVIARTVTMKMVILSGPSSSTRLHMTSLTMFDISQSKFPGITTHLQHQRPRLNSRPFWP
jgi:hypothetical protein